MKKPKPDFNEHRVRNEFVKTIGGQPPRVQVRMCMMTLMQVLNRVGESDEAAAEMQEIFKLMAVVGNLDMETTSEH